MPSPLFNSRAPNWKLRTRTLAFPHRPLVMGILNVTPDSFSDGGKFIDPQAAVAHALKLVDDGADILDIGGESTRPYSQIVSPDDELRRVLPVIEKLVGKTHVPISIDTSKSSVARAALDAGAEIINDVTGLAGDPAMIDVAVQSGAGVCIMHMQGTPQTMADNPTYTDVVAEVHGYLRERRDAAVAAGIEPARICLDPGIGFGKNQQHTLALLRHCGDLHALGCPILIGHSRKGFLKKLVGKDDVDLTNATVAATLGFAVQGVQIVRVHDVRAVRDALTVFEATRGPI